MRSGLTFQGANARLQVYLFFLRHESQASIRQWLVAESLRRFSDAKKAASDNMVVILRCAKKGDAMQEPPRPRIGKPEDSELITEVVTLSFVADPLWSWAMSRDDKRNHHNSLIWALFVDGALRYSSSWIFGNGEAVSVWISPGGSEMSADQESRLRDCVNETLGDRASRFFDLLAQMEDSHPRDEDHFYLSLLGTYPNSRGKGVGMQLLSHDLDLIDAQHRAAYLESSNPNNDDRYQSAGFEAFGQFRAPNGGPTVTTMWRSAR